MNSRITIRQAGHFTARPEPNPNLVQDDVLGALIAEGRAPIVLVELNDSDKEWLISKGVDLKNVYRGYNQNNAATNIFRLNLQTGTFASVDSDHLCETDEVVFTRATKFTHLYVDWSSSATCVRSEHCNLGV